MNDEPSTDNARINRSLADAPKPRTVHFYENGTVLLTDEAGKPRFMTMEAFLAFEPCKEKAHGSKA